MNKLNGHCHRILSWTIGAGLALAPIAWMPSMYAQQAQQDQQPNWGQAGPPPDAQNGQIPDQTQDAAPPPPAAPNTQNQQAPEPQSQQEEQAAPQSQSQPGQWGTAGPPPDVQNGQIPAPPQGQAGRAPYQPYGNQGAYQGQQQGQEQFSLPSGPVTLSPGTLLQVRTSEPLDTRKLQPGDLFRGTVAQSVYIHNLLAIPRGADITGHVVEVKKPGELKGSAGLTLQISSITLGGKSYPVASDTWSMNGPGKGGYTAGNTVGGAALGAVIGAVAGGGPGAAIGAVAGTGVGLGASAATSGPRGVIPPESVLAFHLTQPVTLQPVSAQEARELVQNSAPPQREYPRGYAPYPPGPYGYPPPYAYAAPYPYAYPYPYRYPYVYGYPYPYGPYYRYRRY